LKLLREIGDWRLSAAEMAVRIDRVLYFILLICAIGSSSETGASNHAVTTWSSPPDTRECEDLNKAAQSIPTLCAVIGNEHCAHVKAATTRAMARCNDETGGLGEDQSGTLAAVVKSETEFGRSLKLKLNLGSVRRRRTCVTCQPSTPGSCTAAICTASSNDCKSVSCPPFYVTLSSAAQAIYNKCSDSAFGKPTGYSSAESRKRFLEGSGWGDNPWSRNGASTTRSVVTTDVNGNKEYQVITGKCGKLTSHGGAVSFGGFAIRGKFPGGPDDKWHKGLSVYLKSGVTHPPGTDLKTLGFFMKRTICGHVGTRKRRKSKEVCFSSKVAACVRCNSNYKVADGCSPQTDSCGQSNAARWRKMTPDGRYALKDTCTSTTDTCSTNDKDFVAHNIKNW